MYDSELCPCSAFPPYDELGGLWELRLEGVQPGLPRLAYVAPSFRVAAIASATYQVFSLARRHSFPVVPGP